AVAAGVRDRLAGDSDKRLANSRADLDARIEHELERRLGALRRLLRSLREDRVERLVERSRERGDRAARVGEGALGGGCDVAERAIGVPAGPGPPDDQRELLR